MNDGLSTPLRSSYHSDRYEVQQIQRLPPPRRHAPNIVRNSIKNEENKEEEGEKRVLAIDENEEGAVECGICCFSYKQEDMFHLNTCQTH